MKDGTRVNVFGICLFVTILVAFIFSRDCKGQERDTFLVQPDYTLLRVDLMDVNKDNQPDALLLIYSKNQDNKADRVLVYTMRGIYMGYMDLFGNDWYAFYPDGTSRNVGEWKGGLFKKTGGWNENME